ncbi:uncharacterized protein L3040_009015 [Drepanopeziza brunnea f. sp. 'multigermtubi']|uniref:Uncharacterized protein n=1 Tax=Marssonina brunnea f. sp. multigermtubi (strain MB_m1) TaxID=1072389 RepID=K1W8T7_MARBU|nr:uncharacterized protein MBM_08323 [Drepanopeziza brunnea f. sp. 'multigermtubi' MB_m1]EKD13605.1 hypothetical protein MBM_08323 [Drepanopeziza brunnea f. sp. 'multigermtubi' MB_m1]KAJ5032410.1 hypothetical protein L3040_009015 [Drepanopeziza brunnea f. sp. 'multigermtubi']
MGPTLLRRPSKPTASSQDGELQVAFAEFSQHMEKAKKELGKIPLPPSMDKIKKVLGTFRKSKKSINQIPVATFIKELERDDDNICSLLEAPTFSFILEIALQMEAGKEAERGLFLLAKSLFEDSLASEDEKALEVKKGVIGAKCLLPLLEFFLDETSDFGMRRSTGLLCIQLVSGCEENRLKLDMMKEDTRRSIGAKLIQEPDEILKVICAHLIRAIFREGTPLESLFPLNYDESLYADFPESSQGNAGWGLQFQQYMDSLLTRVDDVPDAIGDLFYASAVQLSPPRRQFGASHHNAILFIDIYQMSFLAPSQEGHFDSTLDIPLCTIKTMTITRDVASQVDSQCITLELENDPVEKGFLDSRPSLMNKLWFSTLTACVDHLQEVIVGANSEVEVYDGGPSAAGPSQPLSQSQKIKSSYTHLTEESPETQNLVQPIAGPSTEPIRYLASQKDSQQKSLLNEDLRDQSPLAKKSRKPTQVRSQVAVESSDASNVDDIFHVDDDEAPQDPVEDIYTASPKTLLSKGSVMKTAPAKVISAIPRKKKVKPKAKIPIGRRGAVNQPTQSTKGKQDSVDDEKVAVKKPALTSRTQVEAKEMPLDTSKKSKKKAEPRAAPAAAAKKVNASVSHAAKVQKTDKKFAQPAKPASAKIYGLPKPAPPKVQQPESPVDAFELPDDDDDDDDESGPPERSTKGVPKSDSKAQAKMPKKDLTTKKDPKKRHSAPAASQKPVTEARHSQRAAASRAKEKMRGADESQDEDAMEMEVEVVERTNTLPTKERSKAIQNSKENAQAVAKPPPKSEKNVTKSASLPVADDENEIKQLQADDSRELGLSPSESMDVDQDQADDLYYATPQKPSHKAEIKGAAFEAASLSLATSQDKARSSGLDLASKLGGILSHLDSGSDQHAPQKTSAQKPIVMEDHITNNKSNEPEQGKDKHISALPSTATTAKPTKEPDIKVNPVQASSPHGAGIGLSPSEFDFPPVPSSTPAAVHESATTMSLVDEKSREEPKKVDMPNLPVSFNKFKPHLVNQTPVNSFKQPLKPTPREDSIRKDNVAENSTISNQPAVDMEEKPLVTNQLKKRKATEADPMAPKRRRSEKDASDLQTTRESDTESVPKSVHIQRKAAVAETPTQGSSGVNKDLDRKPRIIEFSSRGPLNQGVASTEDMQEKREVVADNENAGPTVKLLDRKRKRAAANLAVTSPPSKRKESSPMHANILDDIYDEDTGNNEQTAVESSPPRAAVPSKPVRQRVLPQLASRTSSQPSRVNKNGSPIADGSPVDHMQRLKERLAAAEPKEDVQAYKTVAQVDSTPVRERRHSQIFGPTISLGNKLKARPSSPGEASSRYVPHEETDLGAYNAINSKQVIEPKRSLADPFFERLRKPNIFIERLYSSASKDYAPETGRFRLQESSDESLSALVRGSPTARVRGPAAGRRPQTGQILPELPREAIETKPRQKHTIHQEEERRRVKKSPERKRGATRRQEYDDSMPSDMTSATSLDSHSSESTRTPLQEVSAANKTWNVALRPHYNTVGQAVHRIAEEVIIRLSAEEDKMALLVTHYQENGTKILDGIVKKREGERQTMCNNLEAKRAEMATAYSEARDIAMQSVDDLQENATSHFEKGWRQRQESIRKTIRQGRDSDN